MWLTLMDYSNKTGLSLSTLRRYIKAKKIPYRFEGGKYYLWTSEKDFFESTHPTSSSPIQSQGVDAHAELLKAKEEISELKMLVALYESQQH